MPVERLSDSDADVQRAGAALRGGQLVAIPTETVYGLGANALDDIAVARIFEAKQRPFFDPLIVHVADEQMLATVARSVSPVAQRLIDAFWPGPLTLVLPKADAVPSLVTSGLETVGVRMPSHPVAQRVLMAAGVPVAAPSANPFGRLSPTTAQHVIDGLGDAIEFVVDGGSADWGVESTIVDVSAHGIVRVLRFGALAVETVREVVGDSLEVAVIQTNAPVSPGQLEQHYAPRTTLTCVDAAQIGTVEDRAGIAVMAFGGVARHLEHTVVVDLSPSGDVREAAANLFAALHQLDDGGFKTIFAVRVPDEGLGRAINDRLRRAAATH